MIGSKKQWQQRQHPDGHLHPGQRSVRVTGRGRGDWRDAGALARVFGKHGRLERKAMGSKAMGSHLNN
jgi:hypothetical protein